MKLFLLASVSASIVKRDVEDKTLEGEKRYNQLVDMMTHYNPDFDERKYWAYGCNCLNVGDRAMSDPGYGKPVDDLDAVCKKYKDCVKCAKQEFGEMCIGEFVRVSYLRSSWQFTKCFWNRNSSLKPSSVQIRLQEWRSFLQKQCQHLWSGSLRMWCHDCSWTCPCQRRLPN